MVGVRRWGKVLIDCFVAASPVGLKVFFGVIVSVAEDYMAGTTARSKNKITGAAMPW